MKIQLILLAFFMACAVNGYADSAADQTVQGQGSLINEQWPDEQAGYDDFNRGDDDKDSDNPDEEKEKNIEGSSALSVQGKAIPETASGPAGM